MVIKTQHKMYAYTLSQFTINCGSILWILWDTNMKQEVQICKSIWMDCVDGIMAHSLLTGTLGSYYMYESILLDIEYNVNQQ